MKQASEYLKATLGYLPKYGDEECTTGDVDHAIEAVLADAKAEYDVIAARLSILEAANACYESPETDLREGPWTQGKEKQRQQLQLAHQQLKQQVVSLQDEVQLLIRERARMVLELLGPDSTSVESRLAKASRQVADLKQELAEQEAEKLELVQENEALLTRLGPQPNQAEIDAVLAELRQRLSAAPLEEAAPAAADSQLPSNPGFTPKCHGCGLPSHAARCRTADCPAKHTECHCDRLRLVTLDDYQAGAGFECCYCGAKLPASWPIDRAALPTTGEGKEGGDVA